MKKLFCILFSALLMLTCCNLNLIAFAFDEVSNYLDVKEMYENTIFTTESFLDSISEEEKEFLDNSYTGNIIYNNIMNYIEKNDDVFTQSFGGAYTNGDGNLVVLLTGNIEFCKQKLLTEFNYENQIIEIVKYSYKALKEEVDLINSKIGALVEKNNNGTLTDEKEIELLTSYPRVSIDIENNIISVCLSESTIENSSNIETSRTNSISTNLASEFKSFVNASEKVKISTDAGYEPVELQTNTWRPGQPIVVGLLSPSECSTGYRAKYKYNGTTYSGFVTCGHGNSVGKTVYLQISSTSKVKIGKILDRVYENDQNIDVAFVRLTNSDYTLSNAIYYTSSEPGVTRQGTVLNGTQTTVSSGSRIYKSGRKTYLTSSTVVSTNTAVIITFADGNMYYYTDMIQTAVMTDKGDSGGVAYVVGTGATSGQVVGIATGADNVYSFFTKASNIKNDFGAYAY